MEAQFSHIIGQARKYHLYAEKPNELFNAVNALSQAEIEHVYSEYNDRQSKFQPVNLLRATIARQLLDGKEVNELMIDEIKNRIRQKDKEYFSYLTESYLKQLSEYSMAGRDLFANWQRYWFILHPFIYRDEIKVETRKYLDQICRQLIKDLELPDYSYTSFDFLGPNNFGDTRCWIALYSSQKNNHKEATNN
ncbi:MAG: hypothetical protein LBG19_02830 [Prevotellaceae bacterium]|jgi:hypothetical protein|nr:hypothetical protein [Prevotellaceae bacterium]